MAQQVVALKDWRLCNDIKADWTLQGFHETFHFPDRLSHYCSVDYLKNSPLSSLK